ncbi:MAG: heavy-metal-associated domain-containing protein [Flavobacteriales bacterium]|nr:heavy-metal-associated domain-containing protein [Flavobacteriales bacterium]
MFTNPLHTMRTWILAGSLPLLLLTACSSGPGDAAQAAAEVAGVARVVNEVVIADGTPVTFADLSISGMSCEMMCGGAIKKALAQVQGVSTTEIKFVEGDENDHAIVTYDPAQVSDAQLVEAVQKIHDGQYKVVAVAVTKQVKGDGSASEDGEAAEASEAKVNAELPALRLPSLLELLSLILRA